MKTIQQIIVLCSITLCLLMLNSCGKGESDSGTTPDPTPDLPVQPTAKKVVTINLAAGKFYRMTPPSSDMSDRFPVVGYSDGVMLTDDSLARSTRAECKVGWMGVDANVVVDLGSVRKIKQVRVHAISSTNSSMYFPAAVEVEVSKDKKSWSKSSIKGTYPANSSDFSSAWVTIEFAKTDMRYVKILLSAPIESGSKYAIDEVQAVGDFTNNWKCVPLRGCYHGAFAPLKNGFDPEDRPGRDDPAGIDIFERYVGKKLSMMLWYQGMDEARMFDEMQTIREMYVRKDFGTQCRHFMYGWEATGKTAEQLAQGVNDKFFDNYFKTTRTSAAKSYGPIWFRPINEMNSGWVSWGNDPKNYVKAWRRMYNIAEQQGVTGDNIFVWSPTHASYPDKPWNAIKNYYPGDQYVDWVGVSCYPPSLDQDRFPEEKRYPIERLKELYELYSYKPIMISEGGVSDDCDQVRWVREWFDGVKQNYPMVKALVWENHRHLNPDGSGVERRIQKYPEALKLYKELVKDSYWLDAIPTSFDN